jgi:hypothetical protein
LEWNAIQTVGDYLQWLSGVRESPYQRSLELARRQVADIDPQAAARRSGTTFKRLEDGSGRGMFLVPFLEQKYLIGYPGFKMVEAETRKEPSVYRQVILLHYLATVDDAAVPVGFVNFSGLPHGRPYEHSLQKGALEPLAQTYADSLAHWRVAAGALKGRPLEIKGDESVAFSFWPLPHLPMGVALRPGDDEFPARAQLLVDLNTGKWLPIYDTAIVGRLLCQTLMRLKPKNGRAVKLSEAAAQGDGALYGAPPEH